MGRSSEGDALWRIINRVCRIGSWLFWEGYGIWLALFLSAALILPIPLFENESAVKFVGTVIQVVGLALVLINIRDITNTFEMENPLRLRVCVSQIYGWASNNFIKWFDSNPFRPKLQKILEEKRINTFSATTAWQIGEPGITTGKPLEERVDEIELRLIDFYQEYQVYMASNRDEHGAIRNEVESERKARESQITEVRETVKVAHTGGLAFIVVGSVLMLFGSTIASFPCEIVTALFSAARCAGG